MTKGLEFRRYEGMIFKNILSNGYISTSYNRISGPIKMSPYWFFSIF